MTRPKHALADLPDWPRLLSAEQAAAYVGVSASSFVQRIGNPWPTAVRIGRRKLFDRLAIDRAVDALVPSEPESPAKELERGRQQHAGRQVEAR